MLGSLGEGGGGGGPGGSASKVGLPQMGQTASSGASVCPAGHRSWESMGPPLRVTPAPGQEARKYAGIHKTVPGTGRTWEVILAGAACGLAPCAVLSRKRL